MPPAPPADKPEPPKEPYKPYDRPILPFEQEADPRRAGLSMATSGIELGAMVALGFFGGRWLDSQWDTEPVMSVALTLLGVAGGLTLFIRQALRTSKQNVEAQQGMHPDGDDK